jgi:hypothetical protein
MRRPAQQRNMRWRRSPAKSWQRDNALDVMLPVVYDVQRTVRPDPAPRG